MAIAEEHTRLTILQWLRREVLEKKLNSTGGFIVLVLLAAIEGYMFTNEDLLLVPLAIIALLIGLVLIYYCLFKPHTGLYIVFTIAFFAFYPDHILNARIPLSTGVEVMMLFVFIGSYIYTKKNAAPKGGLINTPVSVILIIYVAYLVCEIFNPNISGLLGWLFIFKRLLVYLFCYVVAYDLIDTPKKFRFFLKYWLVFSFIAGLYGCYQQWFGYLPMELRYIKQDPIEYKLLFQGGTLRKFSFLSDVVAFGIQSGSMSVITLILAVNEKNKKRRRILWLFTLILILGMLYSGTRTTTIILPAGIVLYILMTIRNKKTLLVLFCSVMIAFMVLYAPIDSPILSRIRSTFNPQEESLGIRDIHRHYIQPYIYAHPFGGGVATSGVEGLRFYPGHPLAGFPPDSGFLQVALEQGWIGLFLYVLYNIIILYQGIHFYFRMKSKEYKTYIIGITAALFSIFVTQYAQTSIGQIPHAFFIFSSFSLMKRLLEFDKSEQETITQQRHS